VVIGAMLVVVVMLRLIDRMVRMVAAPGRP
jgi:hypothetical protein